jgi:cyclic pyranopterin phosphate synthase
MSTPSEPLTDLRGRPLRDLRISVIDECNFRCTYCMPAEIFGHNYRFLPKNQLLSFDEIEDVARIFARLGVRKIKLTGGEPLMRPWIPKLVERLQAIPGIEDLGMITNAHHLKPLAGRLRDAGLNRITISLDALDPETFSQIIGGRAQVGTVLEGIDAAHEAGFDPIKINCVVQRGVNEQEILPLLERFGSPPYIVRFIEFMDVGNRNGWRMDSVVPASEIVERVQSRYRAEPIEANYPGEVAERYRFLDSPGEFGVIASVTRPFCGGCTRIRLSAEGQLYTCLFARDGMDLKEAVRGGLSEERIEEQLRSLWSVRNDRYAEQRAEAPAEAEAAAARGESEPSKVEMYYIGG